MYPCSPIPIPSHPSGVASLSHMLESSTHSQHHILGSGSWHQSGSDYCQVLLQVLGLIPSVPVPFPGLGIYLVEAALEADLTQGMWVARFNADPLTVINNSNIPTSGNGIKEVWWGQRRWVATHCPFSSLWTCQTLEPWGTSQGFSYPSILLLNPTIFLCRSASLLFLFI